MDNYEKQVYIGRELFLQHDQDKLIEKYGLEHDEEYLYLKYIGTEYRISRRDGAIAYSCLLYTSKMGCSPRDYRNNLAQL